MISDKIRAAQSVANQSGLILTALSLPREDYETLKGECLQFPITLNIKTDLYEGMTVKRLERKVIYEPEEKIIYAETIITPEDGNG